LLGKLLDELIPQRSDLVAVYQYIRANCKERKIVPDLFEFSRDISEGYKICMNYFKLKRSLEIFAELKLLTYEDTGEKGILIVFDENTKTKTSLEESILYLGLQSLRKHSA
jgi:single-stranded-DNA-specific exonuclease